MRNREQKTAKLNMSGFQTQHIQRNQTLPPKQRNDSKNSELSKAYEKILGPFRLEQLKKLGMNINRICEEIIKLNISEPSKNGFLSNLIGIEGNFRAFMELSQLGARSIAIESPCGNSRIDVYARFDKQAAMKSVNADGSEGNIIIPLGYSAFEVKSSLVLSQKVISQVELMCRVRKNCFVMVLADTIVLPGISEQIHDKKCGIVRTSFTRDELIEEVKTLQQKLRQAVKEVKKQDKVIHLMCKTKDNRSKNKNLN